MKIILTILAFCACEIFSQTVRSDYSNDILILPQGFGIEQLNSKGTSSIFSNTANINAMNPAAINRLVKSVSV